MGDPYTGDPAQEQQGLNSVFAKDKSTLKVIREEIRLIKKKIGISDVCLTNRRKSRKVKRSCRNIFNSSFFGSLDISRGLTVGKSKIVTMQFT